MVNKPLNVLVYSGTGSAAESIRQCLLSLRQILSPNYAVFPVSSEIILNEPWAASCALLVFPGGADLGYCKTLNGDGNRIIKQYVNNGGAYMGLCAGGYYGSRRCEFEIGDQQLEVIGHRELAFYPGICRGSAFKGFQYNSEAGTRAATLRVEKPSLPATKSLPDTFRTYANGGSVFVDAEKFKNLGVTVLASYTEDLAVDSGAGTAAIVHCQVGNGSVILTGPHPEFAGSELRPKAEGMQPSTVQVLVEDDKKRIEFLRACLSKLGLKITEPDPAIPELSSMHFSSVNPTGLSAFWDNVHADITSEGKRTFLRAEQDNFELQSGVKGPLSNFADGLRQLFPRARESASEEEEPKIVIIHDQGWPSLKDTPSFNHETYFNHLKDVCSPLTLPEQGRNPNFGQRLLYGAVVTSTNVLLEKNPKLTSHLAHGTTFTATTQLAGRGRGSNVWISPAGMLAFSTIMKHPLQLNASAPVVFVQYLAALAVAQAVAEYSSTGALGPAVAPYKDIPVRLKWPNDIYILDPAQRVAGTTAPPSAYTKIGGILVNSSYSGGDYTLIVGIGLNVSNAAPTTSLNAVLRAIDPNAEPFSLERLLAGILVAFEGLYVSFCERGWRAEIEALYYRAWLHSEQIVVLETEGGIKARIKGVTSDWGLLLAEEEQGTGRMFALQSDSNSFDFFKGLLKRKL